MEIIVISYFNIVGPRKNPNSSYAAAIPLFIQSLLNNKEVFINGDGNQSRDFTFVANAVQANIKALLTDNKETLTKVFNIACGERVSVNEMFDLIANEIQPGAKAVHRAERFGDVKNSLADISLAKNLLEYDSEILFKDGLKQTIDWFKTSL